MGKRARNVFCHNIYFAFGERDTTIDYWVLVQHSAIPLNAPALFLLFAVLFSLAGIFFNCLVCTMYILNTYPHTSTLQSVHDAYLLMCEQASMWVSQCANVLANNFCGAHFFVYLLGLSKRGLTNIGNYVSWLTFIAFHTTERNDAREKKQKKEERKNTHRDTKIGVRILSSTTI